MRKSEFDITEEQRLTVLNDRIKNLNLEGFNSELNKLIAEAINDENGAQVAVQTIDWLKKAISVYELELAGGTPVEPVTDPELEEDET